MATRRSYDPKSADSPGRRRSLLPPPYIPPEGEDEALPVGEETPPQQSETTIKQEERDAGQPLIRSLPFLFHEAITNLRRHRLMTVAAITTIAVTLALLGAFLVTFYEIDTATRHAVSSFEINIFCRTGLPKEEVDNLAPRIHALRGVATITFRSREQVWDDQKKNYPIDISGIPNQMNDTFIVKLSDPAQAGKIAQTARNWREVQEVAVPEDELNGVRSVAHFLRTVGGISSVILLLGSLIVVSNTIRASVAARHREIKIMQIVGASPWFIRVPLLLEGLIHGIAGGSIACLCLFFAGKYVDGLIRTTIPMLLPYGGPIPVLSLSLALIGAGAIIGAGGSLLSMRRYLRIH